MDSRRDAGAERERLPEISRRLVVVGASAATVAWRAPATAAAIPDERTRQLTRWLSLTTHIERLQDRWARLDVNAALNFPRTAEVKLPSFAAQPTVWA